jgi:hypothetical protein
MFSKMEEENAASLLQGDDDTMPSATTGKAAPAVCTSTAEGGLEPPHGAKRGDRQHLLQRQHLQYHRGGGSL